VQRDPAADKAFRRALLNRVADSPGFQKSNRQRQLLLFLGEKGLEDPDGRVREHDIGVEVFGRPDGYDTGQDTLVRVQAYQLRKRLKEYFEGEGKDEPVAIDLPKGVYALTFKERNFAVAAGGGSRWHAWRAWAAAAVLSLAVLALVADNARLRHARNSAPEASPLVDAFWNQVFANRLINYLVLSDVTLTVFEDRIGRDVPVQAYQKSDFDPLAQHYIPNPAVRDLTLSVLGRLTTGVADANMARIIGSACAANRIQLSVVLAREMREVDVASQNTVLLGSRRANPWINLFEDKLAFRTVFQESPSQAWFENRTPRAGEAREYRGNFDHMGYCRVAFLRNPKGTGSALLISGTEAQCTDAGGQFITSEKWLRTLREALKMGASERYPHFEVLLGGRLVRSRLPEFQLLAVRRY